MSSKTKKTNNRLTLKDGIKDGFPIAVGYFPIAMAFGILSKGIPINLYETLSFSFIVFAGASQFIAIGMISAGASSIEIIMTTFFLNFRHFLMSASLANKINFETNIFKPVISFFVTDESFSVASFAKGNLTISYMLPMQLMGYLGWGIGTGVGYIVGSVLPPLLQLSMNIGLYAMFIALLIPELKKGVQGIVLSISAAICNTLLKELVHIQGGWSIVITIVIVSLAGTIIFNRDNEVASYE